MLSDRPSRDEVAVSIGLTDRANCGEKERLPVREEERPRVSIPLAGLHRSVRSIVTAAAEVPLSVPIDHEPARLKRGNEDVLRFMGWCRNCMGQCIHRS